MGILIDRRVGSDLIFFAKMREEGGGEGGSNKASTQSLKVNSRNIYQRKYFDTFRPPFKQQVTFEGLCNGIEKKGDDGDAEKSPALALPTAVVSKSKFSQNSSLY